MDTQLIESLIAKIDSSDSLDKLQQLHTDLIGKHGLINTQFANIKNITQQDKLAYINKLKTLKSKAESLIKEKKDTLEEQEINKKIRTEYIDTSLPGRKTNIGTIHPLSNIIKNIIDILSPFGFSLIDGCEIDNEWNNFTGLNIQKNHPARQMHDTFYLKEEKDMQNNQDELDDKILLRTHGSNMQIRFSKDHKPPFRYISYGRTYRCDFDSTHTPMFHQIDCVVIDENLNFANMKFILNFMLKKLLGNGIQIRFRPSYFPFTSPSCEVDVKLPNQNTWLELMGCGVPHPKVLENTGIDPSKWQGFAFGAGIERLAMIKYAIHDIRLNFEGNIPWTQHYGFSPVDFSHSH